MPSSSPWYTYGRAAVQVEDGGQHLGGLLAVFAVVPEAGDGPGLVVVAPIEAVPAALPQGFLPAAEGFLQVGQQQLLGAPLVAALLVQGHVLELEHHVHFPASGVGEQHGVVHRHPGHLTHGEQVLVPPGKHFLVHLLQEFMDAGAADVVRAAVAVQHAVGPGTVRQGLVLGDEVDDVHPEAVHAAVQPPVHHVVDGGPDLRVFPVEVRLFPRKEVEVVLPGRGVVLPGRAGECGTPVVGLCPCRAGLRPFPCGPPPVPVPLRAVLAGARLREPGVLVGGVVDHEVHDQLHAAGVQAVKQLIQGFQAAEDGVNVPVVADVVAVVILR